MREKMEKEKVELRYYEIPQELPLMALLGERRIMKYGSDKMHFHNHLEIGYCYFGEGKMYLGEQEKEYQAGSITIIPKNFPHHTRQSGEEPNRWEYLFIDIDRFLKDIFSDRPVVYTNTLIKRLHSSMLLVQKEEQPELEALVQMLLNEIRDKGEFYKPCVEGILLALLLKIARLDKNEVITDVSLMDKQKFCGIQDALNYVEQHYQEEFRIGELAEICHMSETHFRRVFHSYMNTSPVEYVNLVRIEKSCELLKRTNERVEDIAHKVGFGASCTYIRNFKKVTGLAPLQWRNSAWENGDNPANFNVSVLKGW